MNIILHIGQTKTASTTLQRHLFNERATLAAQGVRYCQSLGRAKARLATEIFRDHLPADERQQVLDAFRRELDGPWNTLIISNENLFRMSDEAIGRFKDVCEDRAGQVRVHAYVRRPAEHFPSYYQQKIKGLSLETADDFLSKVIDQDEYSHFQILERWRHGFGDDSVKARLFDRRILAASPTEDFLAWIGHADLKIPPAEIQVANPSLDPVAAEAVRYLARLYMERPDAVEDREIFAFRDAMLAASDGSKLQVSARQAERLDQAFRPDMELFAEHYLSPREAELWLAPAYPGASVFPSLGDILRRTAQVLGGSDPDPIDPALMEDDPLDDNERFHRFAEFAVPALESAGASFASHYPINQKKAEKLPKRRKRFASSIRRSR